MISEGAAASSFQLGGDDTPEDRVDVTIEDMRALGTILSLSAVSMGTQSNAHTAIEQIDQAIKKVSNQRGNLGAILNRMQYSLNFTGNSIESNTTSESTIRDADIATEVTKLTRIQILMQTGIAMLSHANATPETALSPLHS